MQEESLHNDQEIDKMFKEALSDAEVTPPAFLWDEIAAKVQPTPQPKNNTKWIIGGSAALLLLISTATYFTFFNSPEQSTTPSSPASVDDNNNTLNTDLENTTDNALTNQSQQKPQNTSSKAQQNTPSNNDDSVADTVSNATISIEPKSQPTIVNEPTSNINPSTPEVKKPKGLMDKYKDKVKKDSTRSLFIKKE